ncbi:MAG: methyltransferase domain-containing protein [Acidimicrobiales bacterium]|nr:methyltransferase domain-containing protein [Acidimicrobiales bacterium]
MSEEPAAIEGARAYEALHVPALFGQWASPVLDAAGVKPGDAVVDVACGTGVLARHALNRVGSSGRVVGLDVGAGMLAVAADIEPDIEWIEGNAGDLPFDDAEFDAVVSQFGLMFFPNRAGAISEMLRCLRSGGHAVVAVWDSLERSGPYQITVDLLQRRAGTAAADALRAPFVLGDISELSALFAGAGATEVSIDTQVGTARFPSVRTMFEADLRGWLPIMGVDLDEQLIGELLIESEELLAGYVVESGEMVFPAPAHIVTAAA